jgi:hypothetical protein
MMEAVAFAFAGIRMALIPADMVALRVEGVNWKRVLNFPISLTDDNGWRCCSTKKSRQQRNTSAVRKTCRVWSLARVGMSAELVRGRRARLDRQRPGAAKGGRGDCLKRKEDDFSEPLIDQFDI